MKLLLLLRLLFLLAVLAQKAPGLSPLFCSEPQQHQTLLPACGPPPLNFFRLLSSLISSLTPMNAPYTHAYVFKLGVHLSLDGGSSCSSCAWEAMAAGTSSFHDQVIVLCSSFSASWIKARLKGHRVRQVWLVS